MTVTETRSQTSYLSDGWTLRSWLLTTDHKRIALLYFVAITFFFFVGGIGATLVRYNLLSSKGLLGSAETYNRLFSMHGVVMVWFFLVPAVPTTLGNFLVPLMLGARDLAFPRLNLLSWYLFILAGLVALYALIVGGVDTGWTFYTPLTSFYSKGHVVATIVAVFIAGFSSIATGLNFIVSIHKLRAPGMTWHKMPVFLWSLYATSVIMVLATPVLAMTLLLVAFERLFRIGVFDPAIGGDPLLFQHLFWFYSHPAVYIMILPGFGVVSEIVPAFSRKELFGYKFVVWASVAIAVIGFLVWGHHMFVAGTSLYSALVFSILSYMVAVPSAIKVFNWLGTMHKGFIRFDAPMLYALGFIGLFTMGGIDGPFCRRARRGRAPDADLLRRRAFSLCDGGWDGLGLFRSAAFLVAQDHRTALPGDVGSRSRHHHFRRIQPDFLPTIHSRLSRDAAPLQRLSPRIRGVERALLRWRDNSGDRLSAAARLSDLVALLRRPRRRQSLERHGSRVDNIVASAHRKFRNDAHRDPPALSVSLCGDEPR